MVWLLCVWVEMVVEFVHSRYDGSDIGRVLGEKESGPFVYLYVKMCISSALVKARNDFPEH